MTDVLLQWSGEPIEIGFGERLGIAVVDFQLGFTRDPEFLMDGAPLIERAVLNTARLLQVARARGVPVASCYTAYASKRDMPHWKGLEDGRDLGPRSPRHPTRSTDPRSRLRLRGLQIRRLDLL